MRIVTYARVSTVRQESEGQSLVNQERAFEAYIKRTQADRIAAFAESKSAKSIQGRLDFLRMIKALPTLEPDLIVVDTIDRFSRNLQDGLHLLEMFRGHGVRLLPLDWDEPVDLDNDRDWKNVVQELTAADYERRRIRVRINKSYAARQQRGATLHNRAPFGLRKVGDHLVPDPIESKVIQRVDKMFIAGKTHKDIMEYLQETGCPRAWHSRHGISHCLTSLEYVRAGVRTQATQAKINERIALNWRFAKKPPRYVHPMTGIFGCGLCVGLGKPVHRALLRGAAPHGPYTEPKTPLGGARLVCQARDALHPWGIGVVEALLATIFAEIIVYCFSKDEILEKCCSILQTNIVSMNAAASRRRLETLEARLDLWRSERMRILAMLPDTDPFTTVKFRLKQIDDSEHNVSRIRRAVLQQMETLQDIDDKDIVSSYRASIIDAMCDWEHLDPRRANDVARELCRNLGSHPLMYRNTGCYPNEVIVTWFDLAPDIVWRIRYGSCFEGRLEALPRARVSPESAGYRTELNEST